MVELKTNRPFQERFLDGFDRSQLRQEIAKIKPARFNGLRKKYATWALGASLAFGGLGIPMKMLHDVPSEGGRTSGLIPDPGIAGDLKAAGDIAARVASGVATGVQAAANGVSSVGRGPLQSVVEAPTKIAAAVAQGPRSAVNTAEALRENFFNTKVPFGSIIYSEARKNNIAPELVAAVVNTESRFVPTARSHAGAIGLMQLVPKTGRWMGARDLTNPVQNIAAGTKYLRYLNDRFHGDEQKTIAAFNAGEGNVRRFGGVPPFQETRNYITRVHSFQRTIGDQVSNHTMQPSTQVAQLR